MAIKFPKKTFLILTLLTIAVGYVGFNLYKSLIALPESIYQDIILEKTENRYFQLNGDRSFITKAIFDQSLYEQGNLPNEKLWKHYQFLDFRLPWPVRHPLFELYPLIVPSGESKAPLIGYDLQSVRKTSLFSMRFFGKLNFTLFPRIEDEPALLKYPAFRRKVLDQNPTEVFKDLFGLNLEQENLQKETLFYYLYLYYLRNHYFDSQTKDLAYLGDGKGIAQLIAKDKNYLKERVFYRYHGEVYLIDISTRKKNEEARLARRRFLLDIQIKPSTHENFNDIYDKFLSMPYQKRLGQEGFLQLYSAWSQVPLNKNVFHEVVEYLEKRRDALFFLEPFYHFGYRQFGKNYMENNRYERMEKILQQKIENAKERDWENLEIERGYFRDEFPSHDARIDYYLKQVKKNQKSSDLKNKVIIE